MKSVKFLFFVLMVDCAAYGRSFSDTIFLERTPLFTRTTRKTGHM